MPRAARQEEDPDYVPVYQSFEEAIRDRVRGRPSNSNRRRRPNLRPRGENGRVRLRELMNHYGPYPTPPTIHINQVQTGINLNHPTITMNNSPPHHHHL